MKTEEQLAAIARFKLDHFPTLDRGVVSKDIVKEMREDFALIVAEQADTTPDVPITSEGVMEKLARDFSEPTGHGIDKPKTGKGRA